MATHTDNSPIVVRLGLAETAAREGGAIARKYFRNAPETEIKPDGSPVTIADREAELSIRSRIRNAFPDDAILGEEFEDEQGDSGYRWTIDPIDGTKSYVCGVPLFGTLIGIRRDDRTEAGILYLPMFDELYAAYRGGGTTCNGEPCRHICGASRLEDAVMVSSGFEYATVNGPWGQAFRSLLDTVRLYRTWGDCYGWALLLRGCVDIVFDPGLKVWDMTPLEVLTVEAGGVFHMASCDGEPGVVNCLGTNKKLLNDIFPSLT